MAGALGSKQGFSTHGEGLQLGGEFPQLADRAEGGTDAKEGQRGGDFLGVVILNCVEGGIGAHWDAPFISHVDGFEISIDRARGDQGSRNRRLFVIGELEE